MLTINSRLIGPQSISFVRDTPPSETMFAGYDSIIGWLIIEYENDSILSINISIESNNIGTRTSLTDKVHKQLTEYFSGDRKTFDFPYALKGTDFQLSVWNALSNIPYGETRSYKDIAIEIGNPNASRAVGMANNHNPMMVVIPCHRVIGSNGKMVGYAGGLDIKEKLLSIESNR